MLADSAPRPDVYLVTASEPEVGAYAMAKYSRSALSMRESLRELDGQKAEKFLNTFYFQYGHRSIADLAHLSFAIERLSILAAIEVADESRWDGQERSTRYQQFRNSGVVTPAGLVSPAAYAAAIASLMEAYERARERVESDLARRHPQPERMTPEAYRRVLRARAFDAARYLLPLGTATSLGQIVSARTLEQQIVRLLSSPVDECQQLGRALKQAASAPGVVPTLVKYTDPSPYLMASRTAFMQAAAALLGATAPDSTPGVRLVAAPTLEIEIAASLLYPHCHHSYTQVLDAVAALPATRRVELLELGRAHRGAHDELPRPYQAGQPLQFDILMDIGGFRDLHRHRRCVQLHQEYTPLHGFEVPSAVVEAEAEGDYRGAMATAGIWVEEQQQREALYALPLGYRKRSVFKMDFAEAAYIAELRTGIGGHISYRTAAWQMFEALRERHPELARGLRVTDPSQPSDPLVR